MTTKEVIEGLEILRPYYDKPDGHNIGADHDVIYAYATQRPLSDADVERMIALGWHQEHDGRGDYEEDMTLKDYRMEESWNAFV